MRCYVVTCGYDDGDAPRIESVHFDVESALDEAEEGFSTCRLVPWAKFDRGCMRQQLADDGDAEGFGSFAGGGGCVKWTVHDVVCRGPPPGSSFKLTTSTLGASSPSAV